MINQKRNIMLKPQINISYSSSARMWLVFSCAFLCIIQSALTDNGLSLIIALTSLFTALFVELLLTWKKSGFSKILDGSAAATAMTFSLLLPNQIHPVYAAIGSVFAIIVVKYSFGGLGSNWLNPALGGWLFIRFSWHEAFEKALNTPPLASNASIYTGTIDNSVTSFLNNSVFSLTGVQLPSGYIYLLFSNEPGIIADRGIFMLLIGTLFITVFGISRNFIPVVFIAVYAFFIRLAGDASGELWNGDILFGLFSGGTIACAFIIAAEPSSGAKLVPGVLLSVFIGAFLSWVFRYQCLEYTGCFIALAAVNCCTPLIRLLEDKLFLSHRNKAATEGGL